MIPANQLFDLAKRATPIFSTTARPFGEALRRLPDYFAAIFKDSWPLAGMTGLISEPLVIVENELVLDKLVAIEASGQKGGVRVLVDDEERPDAALIMPGAYLFDDRVIIGPGTVVEPGALIKGPTVIGDKTEVRQGGVYSRQCACRRRMYRGPYDGSQRNRHARRGQSGAFRLSRRLDLGAQRQSRRGHQARQPQDDAGHRAHPKRRR
ncbi:MAG: hypothetical protein M5R36_20700 [Deltaproteobacteria bacterium]|nr:hypothetical protein [Deltaproteobacteria bacterium]